MGEKIVVGPINQGLRNDRTAFVIDNDAFPTLINAYQWRGRVKRKRGTSFLSRLRRYFNSTSVSYSSTSTIAMSSGAANILTGFSLESSGNIVPGTVKITNVTTPELYEDPSMDGTLVGSGGGTGTIVYSSGAITITGGGGDSISAVFNYYPVLPVMGIEDFMVPTSQFPQTIDFDTKYAYRTLNTTPSNTYSVSFYKNPPTGTYTGYTQKTNPTPVKWNSQDYQQVWTTNYQNALWATNGITVPFVSTNVGMQYKPIVATTITAGGPPAIVNLQITGHGLTVGDFLFINEVPAPTTGINYQTGYVTAVVDVDNVTVEFPNAILANNSVGGIAQYLTRSSDSTKDCMRWYDGDPTDGNASTPTLDGRKGWVNFCPPLSNSDFSISDLPADQYYLVTARMVLQFKDRLLFFGPVVQTSTAGSQRYLQDTIIYSQNGTPYYTASFEDEVLTNPVFHPILVPDNQTAFANAFFEDVSGFGGNIQAGFDQPINTIDPNEDVLIVGFSSREARLVYTGSDFIPFNLFIINSEYGSTSTFGSITLDRGALKIGNRGIILTSQISSQRTDLEIPDQIFQFNLTNNGTERVTARRDFINEWIYFSYPDNEITWKYPNQTLLYNYRDQSWSIFLETYTTYGQFRKVTGNTWATIGEIFPTWSSWNEPWNAGSSTLLQPQVLGGNQHGFLLLRDDGTQEGNSLMIKNISFPSTITGATNANPCVLTASNTFQVGERITISGVGGMTQLNGNTYNVTAVSSTTVTINADSTLFGVYTSGGTATPEVTVYSPDHCLNAGDYFIISGAIGSVASLVNGKIFSVGNNPTTQGFNLNPPLSSSGTYFGGGLIKRMYIPMIRTKQFPVAWGMSRKTRLGPQQYLLTKTDKGQVELQIFLSQNDEDPYNSGNIVPQSNTENNGLVYSDILFTCPESTNLGLTPANTNLNLITASQQQQIWHRMNTSLLGDTVQVGITMSDAQMRDTEFKSQFAEIELHSIILDVSPSQILA